MKRTIILAAIVVACTVGNLSHAWGASTDTERLKTLTRDYVAAQVGFDQASVRRLTASGFVEVSPKGEVDERNSVVDFYAPEKRTEAPPYEVSNQRVRVTGHTAVITQTVTFGVPPRSMGLTQAVTASRVGRHWLLTSSQSTPIVVRPDESQK